jgi:protoheme ferro-lyase
MTKKERDTKLYHIYAQIGELSVLVKQKEQQMKQLVENLEKKEAELIKLLNEPVEEVQEELDNE